MSVLALSGWGQPEDALSIVAPDALTVDYGRFSSLPTFFAELSYHKHCDVAVGWSLGGQLLVRAIAAGVIHPQRLVLLAAPFQIQASDAFPVAAPAAMLAESRMQLEQSPARMLKQFQAIIAMGDSKADEIVKTLRPAVVEGHHWFYWFDLLTQFSCLDVCFSGFPLTNIVHGENDAIVRVSQAHEFAKRLPQHTLHLMKDTAHAPHLHDAGLIRNIISG